MAKQLKKRTLEKELSYLSRFEIYGALLFMADYFIFKYVIDMNLGEKAFKINWISFFPLLLFSLILVEGSCYWRNKLKMIKKQKFLNNIEIGRIYNKLKWINEILLIAYIPLIIVTISKASLPSVIIGIFFYLMAIIEQINYFHIRLSFETVRGGLLIIDPLKKLFTGKGKRSQLRKDIDSYLSV